MKIDAPSALALMAVIRADLDAVAKWNAALRALPEGTAEDLRAISAAYYLHNIYNALENSFDQISRTFENHVKDLSRWHQELLAKMFLDISPLRPAVLPPPLRPFLDELRGFRHVFRHGYDYGLDPAKVAALRARWVSEGDGVTQALCTFADRLEQVGRLDAQT